MKFTDEDLRKIHTACTNNGNAIRKSKMCGCFACGEIYPAELIAACLHELDGDGDNETCICAKANCHVDSVLGDFSLIELGGNGGGYELTQELVDAMKKFYFY